ncbi:cupin domain-containing protein [Lentisphaerota bacterium ZTH]|nr:cupin domain-containing protein [Lentisphaerota bacterium]WET07348.1 cupin domain-containing protein [Lentisphaerota bacterium ZTH]
MIRRDGDYQVDIRTEMRGGSGDVRIEHLWDEKNELKGRTRLCARITLQPGCSIGFHRHEDEEEVFYIIEGQAEADDNGESVILNAGDTILTADGAGHAIKCVSEKPLVMAAFIASYK